MKINPEILKSQRNELGLSQQSLSEKSKVGIATIKRLEGGDVPENMRELTIKKLASTLEISPEDLCSLEYKKSSTRAEKLRGPQYIQKINASKDFVLRADLLARRYNLSRMDIMNMMPIAFLFLAEEVQRKRRNKLKAVNSALNEAGNSRHYRSFTSALSTDDFMNLEHRSILNNELFAESFQDEEDHWFDPYYGNPISDHIVEKVGEVFSDLSEEKAANIILIHSKEGPNNLPDDDFLDAELEKVSCGNALCKTALRVGEITIDEIPSNASKEPEKFQVWLEGIAPYSVEQVKRLEEFMAGVEI